MTTSQQWIEHFQANAKEQRINWSITPTLSNHELETILPSLQAWQLGETSDGHHLLAASSQYACRINDPHYVKAVKLFIKEEQKHGGNLGRYLDLISKPRISSDWGDTLFRKIRYYNTSMELWTLAVITVESTAQVFYQSLKDATCCPLLKQICTDILIDEAYHIQFQTERLYILFEGRGRLRKWFFGMFYTLFFYCTSLVVWMAHKKVFKAGGNSFMDYFKKMDLKYRKTVGRIVQPTHLNSESYSKHPA